MDTLVEAATKLRKVLTFFFENKVGALLFIKEEARITSENYKSLNRTYPAKTHTTPRATTIDFGWEESSPGSPSTASTQAQEETT
jgi:hypothetical protein